jgi:hypothetical protein
MHAERELSIIADGWKQEEKTARTRRRRKGLSCVGILRHVRQFVEDHTLANTVESRRELYDFKDNRLFTLGTTRELSILYKSHFMRKTMTRVRHAVNAALGNFLAGSKLTHAPLLGTYRFDAFY